MHKTLYMYSEQQISKLLEVLTSSLERDCSTPREQNALINNGWRPRFSARLEVMC